MQRILRSLHALEDLLLTVLLLGLIGASFAQIVLRNLFDTGFLWLDPALKLGVLWLGLLGALVATREHRHIRIDLLGRLLPAGLRRLAHALVQLFTAAVAGLIAWHGALLVADDFSQGSEAFSGMPAWLAEAAIPLGFGLIALRHLLQAFLPPPPEPAPVPLEVEP
ncbi:MAG: TRAP transporter small permease [Gammaproteobacteria bacterium]|nr:MAG: TRAP transporter small permease [Gammaproteobacteria bacterium]